MTSRERAKKMSDWLTRPETCECEAQMIPLGTIMWSDGSGQKLVVCAECRLVGAIEFSMEGTGTAGLGEQFQLFVELDGSRVKIDTGVTDRGVSLGEVPVQQLRVNGKTVSEADLRAGL